MSALLFLPDLDAGGAQRTLINLANQFADDGIDAVLVVGRADGRAKDWISANVALVDLNIARTRQALRPLRKFIEQTKPDVIISTMIDANIIAAIAVLGLSPRPRLLLRETNSHRFRGDIRGFRKFLIGWAHSIADRTISLSSGLADELCRDYKLKPSRIDVIGNPIAISDVRYNAENTPLDLQYYNGPTPDIIAVGRLTKQKGFDLLIRAIAQCRSCPSLLILGEGEDRAMLEGLVAELGLGQHVAMPGYTSNPAPWVARSKIFALSSRWEGFGHVIVEAMAVGTPVLAVDCPYGPADIIAHAEDGWLVEPENQQALVDGIDMMISAPDLRQALSEKALLKVQEFDQGAIAEKYQKALFGGRG